MPSIQFVYKSFDDGQKSILYAWFTAMHTRIDMILCNKAEDELKGIARHIKDELANLEKMANYYDDQSELSKLNQSASEQPVEVSRELYHIIETALQYRGITQGCFDISIQSLNYNKDTWRNIKLLPDFTSIYFQQPGTRIDLSGFIKGYALEKVRNILLEHEVEDALISLGNSSVLGLGNHPHGKGWKVSFNKSTVPDNYSNVVLQNECLTTSGNESKNRKHIIRPETGRYIEGAKQVAVITPNGIEGEVLATSLFVTTPEQQDKILESFNFKGIYTA